jgi:hypothetical protein
MRLLLVYCSFFAESKVNDKYSVRYAKSAENVAKATLKLKNLLDFLE